MTSNDGGVMMYAPVVVWRNGAQGGDYSRTNSEYLCDKNGNIPRFENWEEAKAAAEKLFPAWRDKNPANDGWKAVAWPSYNEIW